jgi:hypothetical protein
MSAKSAGTYQPDEPEADFGYWTKMANCSLWEGAAVLVGINPNFGRDELDMRSSVDREMFTKFQGVYALCRSRFSKEASYN